MVTQEELKLFQDCYTDYLTRSTYYDQHNRYYNGYTDSLANFKPMEGRSNLIVKANFVQKLDDEEAEYSFGNGITYSSIDGNADVINDINYNLKNNQEDYDITLGTELIKYGVAYEISYYREHIGITGKKEYIFKNKIVSPLDGYLYKKDDELVCFLHMFDKQLDDKHHYIDIYTKDFIYHFDTTWKEIESPTPNHFGFVPVGYGYVGGIEYNDSRGYVEGDKTNFKTIKDIQDSFETNWSDMVSEVSDFRNAILKLYGVEIKTKKDKDGNDIIGSDGNPVKETPIIRDNCILSFEDKSVQDAEWLIKSINDTFIKNTRDDLKDLIYTLTSHIDNNEKMQSNLSGIALRSKLHSLEAKCNRNEMAMANIIKTRIKCLFRFLYLTENKVYDTNLINIKFTPNIPQDLVNIADVISKIPHEVLSNETKREMLPVIENAKAEQERIDKENDAAEPKVDLDNILPIGNNNAGGEVVER